MRSWMLSLTMFAVISLVLSSSVAADGLQGIAGSDDNKRPAEERQGGEAAEESLLGRRETHDAQRLKELPLVQVHGGDYAGKVVKRVHAQLSGPKIKPGPYRPARSRGAETTMHQLLRPASREAETRVAPLQLWRTTALTNFAPFGGDETTAATAGDIVFLTANVFAAYSSNGGASFTHVDPGAVLPPADGGFCCDQVVQYVPSIDRFIWVSLYWFNPEPPQGNGQNRIRIAAASPNQLVSSRGTAWDVWDLTPEAMGGVIRKFDFPDLAFGTADFYITANVVDSKGRYHGLATRLSLADVAASRNLGGQFVISRTSSDFRIVQNTSSIAYFADFKSYSQLRIFSWPENSASFSEGPNSLRITTVATRGFKSLTPQGFDWLSPRITVPRVTGATKAGNRIWLAWLAGRSDGDWPQPHVEIATIDAPTLNLIQEQYIWAANVAYSWPALSTNSRGEVGISFTFGGQSAFPSYAVGFLSPNPVLIATIAQGSSVKSQYDGMGAGGADYTSIHPASGAPGCFAAAGWIETGDPNSNNIDVPQYVLFGRQGDTCVPQTRNSPLPH